MHFTFLGALLATCSLFRLSLPFECTNFFKKESQRPLSVSFDFKKRLLPLLKIGKLSAISSVAIVLVTIVTPHAGCLRILRSIAYSTGNRFIIINRLCSWTVGMPDFLQVLQTLKVRSRFHKRHFININVGVNHNFISLRIS
jgi:hypothetical protein